MKHTPHGTGVYQRLPASHHALCHVLDDYEPLPPPRVDVNPLSPTSLPHHPISVVNPLSVILHSPAFKVGIADAIADLK